MTAGRIRDMLLQLAHERGSSKTFCPSEVARSLSNNWRPLMEPIRKEAASLVEEGSLICTQKGKAVDPREARGAIRFSLPPH